MTVPLCGSIGLRVVCDTWGVMCDLCACVSACVVRQINSDPDGKRFPWQSSGGGGGNSSKDEKDEDNDDSDNDDEEEDEDDD